MGWNNSQVFQFVIITGQGGGLFVYSGAPGLGNSPVFAVVAPGVTVDPYGNAVASIMTAGNLAGAFTQIDGSGDILMYNAAGAQTIVLNPIKQAMFVYSPAAGLGNLVSSVAAVGGTDAFGNAYLTGTTSYKKILSTDFRAVQQDSGGLTWWIAGGAGGPWSIIQSLSLQADEVGLGLFSSVNANSVVFNETAAAIEASGLVEILSGGLSWVGGAAGDTAALAATKNADGSIFQTTNNQAAPSGAAVRFRAAAAGDRVMAIDVLGETNRRFRIDSDGTHNWGSGAAPPDSVLFRAAANLLAADYLAFANGAAAEAWTAVTFANGWANAGLEPGLQFRRVAAPDNCVQVVGAITVPAGFAAGQNITTALPAGYRPAKTAELSVFNSNTVAVARIVLTTGGVFQYQAGGNAAGNSLIIPAGNLIALTA